MDIGMITGGLASARLGLLEDGPLALAGRLGPPAIGAAPLAGVGPGPAVGPVGMVGALPFPPMPAVTGFLPRMASFVAAERGYAPPEAAGTATPEPAAATTTKPSSGAARKASTAKASAPKPSTPKPSTTTKKTSSSSSSTSSAGGTAFTAKDLTFLKDKKLSIEEKLFRFMALLIQKGDQELIDAMNGYAGKKATTSSAGSTSSSSSSGSRPSPASSSGSSGSGGNDALDTARSVAKDVGGPLLAAAVTAMGLPELAPAAMSIGGTVAEGVVDVGASLVDGVGSLIGGLFGGSDDDGPHRTEVRPAPAQPPPPSSPAPSPGKSSSGGSSSSLAGASEVDEKLQVLQLQRLVEKQNTMYSALSNVLKSLHDSQMTAVQNIR